MDIRELQYFIVVAEELNITNAAKRLNMSQPPLSMCMKSLEEELHTTLFIRGKRSLKLTESGELLYRRAKEIISLSETASSEIIALSEGMSGTISIGLVEGMAPDIVADWFSKFMKKYPQVKFRILDGNSDDLTLKLRSGLISLAVVTAPIDQHLLNSFKIGEEKAVALMNINHPLSISESDEIEIIDLKDEPLIVPSRKAAIDRIYKWFRKSHIEPNIVCEMDSYLDATAFASNNLGISIFPQTAYVPNTSIVSKKIKGEDTNFEYYFVWIKGRPLPVVETILIDFIKDIVNK